MELIIPRSIRLFMKRQNNKSAFAAKRKRADIIMHGAIRARGYERSDQKRPRLIAAVLFKVPKGINNPVGRIGGTTATTSLVCAKIRGSTARQVWQVEHSKSDWFGGARTGSLEQIKDGGHVLFSVQAGKHTKFWVALCVLYCAALCGHNASRWVVDALDERCCHSSDYQNWEN